VIFLVFSFLFGVWWGFFFFLGFFFCVFFFVLEASEIPCMERRSFAGFQNKQILPFSSNPVYFHQGLDLGGLCVTLCLFFLTAFHNRAAAREAIGRFI